MLSSELTKLLPSTESVRMLKPTGSTGSHSPAGSTEHFQAAIGGPDLPQGSGKAVMGSGKVEEAVGQLNDYVQSIKRDLKFSVDDDSGRVIVKVIDSNTKELIRQIPSEDVLTMARNLGSDSGMLMHVKA